MHLRRLTVQQFRNIAQAELDLQPGINVLWGANAQGKTNLLEAIHLLATGRSFRTNRERECIRRESGGEPGDETAALIRVEMVSGGAARTLQIGIQNGRRHIEVDGDAIRSLAQLWGQLRVVLFTPDDLQILKGPPALRRRFLDIAVSQVRPPYLAWLQRHQGALRERNALLRLIADGRQPAGELDAWDAALAEAAAEIQAHRHDVTKRLEELAAATHEAVSGRTEKLRLVHRGFPETQEPLTRDAAIDLHRRQLLAVRQDDIYRGRTSVGPHRDDLLVFIDDAEARTFASQGQHRAVILALRLAEVALIEDETGDAPTLLLDDILSELDPARRRHFFAQLPPHVQTIVTTVEPVEALEGIQVDAATAQ
jgi:DNA replication and repair protein RecF